MKNNIIRISLWVFIAILGWLIVSNIGNMPLSSYAQLAGGVVAFYLFVHILWNVFNRKKWTSNLFGTKTVGPRPPKPPGGGD